MRRHDSSPAPGAARPDAICDRKAIAASGVSTFASTAACRSLSLYIGVVLFVRSPCPANVMSLAYCCVNTAWRPPCHPGEGRDLNLAFERNGEIPAFAGMTEGGSTQRLQRLHPRHRPFAEIVRASFRA